ncbi:hypothetical protein Hanom_Chr04g00339121 [Helianthus anomalus]
MARNCTKLKVNREQTPIQPAPPNSERALVTATDSSTAVGGSTPCSALVVQPNDTFDWNAEIQRLNISAPENQTASDNITFMTSAPEDKSLAPEEEVSAENLALMAQILSAPVHGLTREEKIEAQHKDINKLEDDLSVKTTHYLEVKEKVCILTKELEDIREKYNINELNIKKYEYSSKLVKDLRDLQLAYKRKKGCGLGFNQVPPYNDNYTYLPVTEEELMNESTMTYGPKTDKSSRNSKSVEKKRPIPVTNFVSKGMFDPNGSFVCADKVVDSKCEDILGGEQVSNSDFSSDFSNIFLMKLILLMCWEKICFVRFVLLRLVGLMFWAKLLMVRYLRIRLVKPLKLLLKKIKNILIVLLNRFQWMSLMLNLVETMTESRPQVDSRDTCVDETCVDEISTCSKIETESESIKAEKGVEINEQSPANVSKNKDKAETTVLKRIMIKVRRMNLIIHLHLMFVPVLINREPKVQKRHKLNKQGKPNMLILQNPTDPHLA